MAEFMGYLKDAVHIGRVVYMIVMAVVFWLLWHDWTHMMLWFGLCAGIILADAIYEYVQIRVRRRFGRRYHDNHA